MDLWSRMTWHFPAFPLASPTNMFVYVNSVVGFFKLLYASCFVLCASCSVLFTYTIAILHFCFPMDFISFSISSTLYVIIVHLAARSLFPPPPQLYPPLTLLSSGVRNFHSSICVAVFLCFACFLAKSSMASEACLLDSYIVTAPQSHFSLLLLLLLLKVIAAQQPPA